MVSDNLRFKMSLFHHSFHQYFVYSEKTQRNDINMSFKASYLEMLRFSKGPEFGHLNKKSKP